ncbi:MAG: amino acid adenylation domain-containing protein [Rhodanobacteraceae bacterium]
MNSSNLCNAETPVDYDPFAGTTLAWVVPSTESQREIWLATRLEPDASLAYNESVSLEFFGALDVEALQAALSALIERHEALRSTFNADGEELHIAERAGLHCELRDLAPLHEQMREAEIAATLQREVETPFDLEHGPLVRAELLRLSTRHHLLVFTAHHIVCDGWSFGVIVRDLAMLYSQAAGAAIGELQPAGSFADFALAEAAYADSEACRKAESYWVARFAGTPPVLDLPVDRARAQRRAFRSQRLDHTFDASLLADIKRVGASRGASLYATLLTGFAALFGRICGETDIVIGIPAAGQAAGGLERLVGHCVNVLPLRTTIEPAASFHAALDGVRGDLLDAFEHQRYTLGTLLKRLALPRDPARLPMVSVLFNLDQALDQQTVSFGGLEFEFRGNPRAFENYELFVNAVQADGQLRLECQFNSDLFDAESVRGWLAGYETLLRDAVHGPDTMLARLSIVSDAGLDALRRLQPEATPFDREALVSDLIVAQAERDPQRVAVRCGSTCWTYAELLRRASGICDALRARGIAHGALVGICLERSPEMIAAVIGVLEAGAAYVPLDPSYPRERLNFMARDAGLAWLVAQTTTMCAIDWPSERALVLDAPDATQARPIPAPVRRGDPESTAYVIYTSGSTGKPKGVCVPHRAVVNFLASMRREPGLIEDDRLVAITTLSFDIAVLELLLPLSVGAQVVLATREEALDPDRLADLLMSSRATVMQATPATWRMLLDSGWHGSATLKALCGGEALAPDLAARLLQRVGALWNMYGPTETTVWSACGRIERPGIGISIGRPIANTTLWILDGERQVCPVGIPGEICIGGDGIALGYLHRPELTAERFIAHPLDDKKILYRTGDRGRWTSRGALEHLGRLDFQVKLRGHRIELGEIEATLTAHSQVAQAVVTAREEQPGDMRLTAYVVASPDNVLDAATLRAHLREMLPDYMVPQHFVELDAIPLLPNGKVDRKSLPAPTVRAETAIAHIAPRSEVERRIAAEMEETLALPGIGVDDDFFALGGHSLLAAKLTARLNQQFDVVLSLRSLFDTPTISGLAHSITQALDCGHDNSNRIAVREDQIRAPLSLLQKRLWIFDQLNPGNVVYNTPSAHRLLGKLDEAAFNAAFNDLVRRQPSLRTAIEPDGADVVQRVHEEISVSLFPAEDLSHFAEAERETQLMRRLETLTNAPFELSAAPLFRARMFRLGPEEHALFFMPHHIIWDGWSFDLFYDEFSKLYASHRKGVSASLPELTVTYADFADWHGRWLQGPAYAEQFGNALTLWRERLTRRGAPPPLPTDKPRKERMSNPGATEWITLSKPLAEALRQTARRADATVFMVLLAAYYAMLWRLSGNSNLVVGTPVRVRASSELEKVMGLFTNLLPLPLDVDPGLDFVALVSKVRAVVLDSFASPDVQLEDLMREPGMRELAGRTHFYQAQFSYQDARDRICEWGGLMQKQIPLFQRDVSEDLSVWFLENAEGMIGGVLYNEDLFHPQTARLLARRYVTLLESAVENPHQSIAQMTGAPPDEIDLMRSWNDTGVESPNSLLIHELVEAQVDRGPERTAFTLDSWGTSYAEMEQRANRIAACLRARAVGAGTIVGLDAEPSANRIAATLAILKLGATCVLLDCTQPADYLADVIADARIELLLGDSALATQVNWPHTSGLWFDADTAEIIGASTERPRDVTISPEMPAFAVYARNSAGEVHGTGFTHRALAHTLFGTCRMLGLDANDRILGTAGCATDVSILECMLCFGIGAEFIPISRNDAASAESLAMRVTTSRPSAMFASAELWQSLLSANWDGCRTMKAVCVGAAPDHEVATRLEARCGELWNLFGATCAAIVATCGRIKQVAQGIHAGKPIANATVWVVDADGRTCPVGAIGEICIGGEGTSSRFGTRAEIAASPTLRDFLSPAISQTRLIRTGARGRWLATGEVEILPEQKGSEEALKTAGETSSRVQQQEARTIADLGAGGGKSCTAAEQMLVDLWCEMLGLEEISRADNFFDLGGHSLLAVAMAAKVARKTRVRLNLLKIANSSLGALAAELPQTLADDVAESEASTLGARVRGLFGRGRGKAP